MRTKERSEKYKLLKTSWKHQAKLFFEQSTLHGVRYIAEKDRPIVEKLMWFICVVIGAIASIIIIFSLWEKFQINPTITGLDTDFHTWDVPFPAITICQSKPSDDFFINQYIEKRKPPLGDSTKISDFLKKLVGLRISTLEDFFPYTNQTYLPRDVNIRDFVFDLMNPCEYTFDQCFWKAELYNCCSGFFPVFTEVGYCYTINSKYYERVVPWSVEKMPDFKMMYIKETDVQWAFKFTVNNVSTDYNFTIFIHNSDDIPGVDIKPHHVWDFRVDRILFSVKHTYTTEGAKQLSIKQRKCIFEHERKLKVKHIYTYNGCTQQCRMDASMRLCGCVPHFYTKTNEYKHCHISELACIAKNIKTIEAVDKCGCQLGCLNTIYEVEKSSDSLAQANIRGLEIEFVSWPMVRYKREVLFGWVDLLVSFGGIAGLFLGFSLLSGVEVIYYFTIRACCMVVKEKNELIKMQDEKSHEIKSDYDLSLAPYFIKGPQIGQGRNQVMRRYKKKIINFPSNLEPKMKPINDRRKIYTPPFGVEFIN